jgi:hypothetical protein
MCTIGATQVVVVVALAERLDASPAGWVWLGEAFGIIAAAFLMSVSGP